MFTPTLDRRKLVRFNRNYDGAGLLALIWIPITLISALLVMFGVQEVQRTYRVRASCAEDSFPNSSHSSLDDCLITTGGRSVFDHDFVKIGGATLVGWCLYTGVMLVRWRRRPAFLRALDDAPDSVVWVFVIAFHVGGHPLPGNRRKVILGLRNGERLAFWVRSPAQADSLVADVAACCPGVAVGHSNARERAFAADPSSLRPTA